MLPLPSGAVVAPSPSAVVAKAPRLGTTPRTGLRPAPPTRGSTTGYPSTSTSVSATASAPAPAPFTDNSPDTSPSTSPALVPANPLLDIDLNPVGKETFDFVIAGGGAAGCVLANRLSADPTKKVLLLEAGPGDGGELARAIKAPVGISRLFRSVLDWGIYTDPQSPIMDREMYVARGKVLGGSSATNATLYHRGTAKDYASWGIPGWGPEDVLPWFKKSENNARGASRVHGDFGELHVEDPRYNSPLLDKFMDAAREMGYADNRDFNDWDTPQDGFGYFQVTQHKGQRCDTASAFLTPEVKARPNLTVLCGANVTKVQLDRATGNATGVEFCLPTSTGRMRHVARTVAQTGEVVLAAGAVHTPQIMMLSGLGPRNQLAQVGLPCQVNLPGVGANLQDHPACLAAYLCDDKAGSITDAVYHPDGRLRKRAILNYLLRRRGPFCTTGCDRGIFVRSKPELEQPDLQIRFTPACSLDPDGVSSYAVFGRMQERGTKWPAGFTLQVVLCRPKSAGRVSLRSDSPFDSPSVDTGYLTHPDDLEALRRGLKMAREIAATGPFKTILKGELHPGPSVAHMSCEEEAFIRSSLHSANAVVGTCKMGDLEDQGVVDAQLRVHGVKGLRIADASVMCAVIGGQTGAPAIMIAERAADAMLTGQLN